VGGALAVSVSALARHHAGAVEGLPGAYLWPGFAMEYKEKGFPRRLLAGRSARIVVTMGMPVLLYRWYFGAYGVRFFERSMLSFAGIKPIRDNLYGLTFADDKKRARWIEDMRARGSRGD
jgi:putative NADPH-quinone reductase